MKNTLTMLILILSSSLLTSSLAQDESKNLNNRIIQNNTPESDLVDFSNTPRVEIVKKIDEVIKQAIKEGWSKEEWKRRFGSPRRIDSYKEDIEYIQYYESGPYMIAPKELVTGITIKLKMNKTFDYSYRRTTFGLPNSP